MKKIEISIELVIEQLKIDIKHFESWKEENETHSNIKKERYLIKATNL